MQQTQRPSVFLHKEKQNKEKKRKLNGVNLWEAYLLQKFPVSEGGLLDEVPHSPSILAGHHHTRLPKRHCHLHCATFRVIRRPCGWVRDVRCEMLGGDVSEQTDKWLGRSKDNTTINLTASGATSSIKEDKHWLESEAFFFVCFILHSVLIMITQQTALPCVWWAKSPQHNIHPLG